LIWERLPGNAVVKVAIVAVLVAASVYALFEWVFPWVSETLGIQEQTVGEA
jgi:lipopolysaccharide export LptBFGC system permease protein LptF